MGSTHGSSNSSSVPRIFSSKLCSATNMRFWGKEGRERGRERGREGGRKRGREGGMEGGMEGGIEGRREEGGRRKKERERWGERRGEGKRHKIKDASRISDGSMAAQIKSPS